MQGTKFENIMTAQDLINMSPKLTKVEWTILNDNIEYREARRKAASVLYFLKKHIILNDGFFSKSIDNIYRMFKRNNNYISTGQLKNIVNRLKELGLICIERIKKRNVYAMPLAKILSKKLANKKSIQSTENTDFEDNSKNHRDDILDVNTILYTKENKGRDLITLLDKHYRGMNPKLIADKKDLKKIARRTMTALGIYSNSAYDRAIQYLVYRKIDFCNTEINFIGAARYIETLVKDRINAYNNGEPSAIVPPEAINNFTSEAREQYENARNSSEKALSKFDFD